MKILILLCEILFVTLLCLGFIWPFHAKGQIPELPGNEELLENLTAADQSAPEDDSRLQELQELSKNPMDLNTADPAELRESNLLSPIQIDNLVIYRRLLGKLISLYELQAVPTWDLFTIKRLLPFIYLSNAVSITEDFRARLRQGEHSLLLRDGQTLEKSNGYYVKPGGNYYLGSPQKVFFRYKYQFKNLLQYGVVGDKDAGEQFFKGSQRQGFDFYSFHLFFRKRGIIKALALGDFGVSLGQGLIQWQGLGFRKGGDVTAVKRQGPVLKPYNSAGEFNFHRGLGITLKKGNLESTLFASVRKLSTNLPGDSITDDSFFSSFLNSGFNRSPNELANRNNLVQQVVGFNMSWSLKRLHVGLNGIWYHFSLPLQKRPDPYNLFAIRGERWNNLSIDYAYTFHNFHFFGETALDKHGQKATVNGLIISVDSKVDFSFIYRSFGYQYQSINGNAFAESSYPANEKGLYIGGSFRPFPGIRFDAYVDFYSFPWLRYLVDAPSYGNDQYAALTFLPNKQLEIYTRYHREAKQGNSPANIEPMNQLITNQKQTWRTQINYKVTREITLRSRVESLWFNKRQKNQESGFLCFQDFIFKPSMRHYAGSCRLAYFESDGYNSRLYAYENDIGYSYSIPVFFDRGWRYYLNLNYDFGKHITCWVKWGQTIYKGSNIIGSGLDEISGHRKSEIKLQAMFTY